MSDFEPSRVSLFESRHGTHANACVGENGYVDAETYAIGYFQATRQLLEDVLDLRKNLSQDTLVYPILFNFRHGIELSIKQISKVLSGCGIEGGRIDLGAHDLAGLWKGLADQAKADRRLTAMMHSLDAVVMQLHEADPMAQEFRYSELKDGGKSLKDKRIIDLATVFELVNYAEPKFASFFVLADIVATERTFGSFTPELNREELKQLSVELPDATEWETSPEFDEVKGKWREEYKLSNRGFSRAVDFIKEHREFAANIGMAGSFVALSDSIVGELLLTSDRYTRATRNQTNESIFEFLKSGGGASGSIAPFIDGLSFDRTASMVAEIHAIFYLGLDTCDSEEYDKQLEQSIARFESCSDEVIAREFRHVFDKLNFAQVTIQGLRMIGRLDLADKYEQLFSESRDEESESEPYTIFS
tara:strand:- start:44 stop:1297 length:1254 start_codon:yes stop_codon:yes gene_type:complete